MKKLLFLFLLCTQLSWSQSISYASILIPEELKKDVNSITREEVREIEIVSQTRMLNKYKRAVTVLNESALEDLSNVLFYSKGDKVKSVEAIIYDSQGKQLKKYARKDFVDQAYSQFQGGVSDDRVMTFTHKSLTFPITVYFEYELETSNTAFVPGFWPITQAYQSIQSAKYRITAPADLGLERLKRNLHYFENLEEKELANGWEYRVTAYKGLPDEALSPRQEELIPQVLFRLKNFSLEGVKATVTDWNSYGKWMYDNMLLTSSDVPENIRAEVKSLVANETTDLGKAKRIYEYMQQRSRYVAIMLGIGGWKPMSVESVHKLGYGDCKALTNYVRVLLNEVGVPAYYTILHSSESAKSMTADFPSFQGNHVILALPQGDDYLFVECTNQYLPFGYMLEANADRDVLVVKPTGGEIVRTPKQNGAQSLFTLTGKVKVDENAGLTAEFTTHNSGNFYIDRLSLTRAKEVDRMQYLREELAHYRQLGINSYAYEDFGAKGEFEENFSIHAEKVGDISSDRILLPIQLFYRSSNIPTRHRVRTLPVEIQSEFSIDQKFEVMLPEGYVLEAKPDDISLATDFGNYRLKITAKDDSTLEVTHLFEMKKGTHPKEAYNAYRKFREDVARADQSKIAIIKR